MPGTDAGHLAQTAMGLARQLLGVVAGTFVSVSLGDPDDVDHLVLGEDVGNGDGLLQLLAGPVHLLGDGAAVELHLHQTRFSTHLCVRNDANDLAVLLHGGKVLLQLLLALLILPLLAVLGEGLLLGFVPTSVLVEPPLALVAHVLSKNCLEGAQAAGGPILSARRGSHHRQNTKNKNKTFCGQVDRLARVVLGEALGLTPVTATPLARQEAQRAVARSRKLTVGLRKTKHMCPFIFTASVVSIGG
uniref:Uncharacterized protein n=1 Tax=Hippocampus comes TaxID=109280 RepID=A0A3Q2XN47_HIPCM